MELATAAAQAAERINGIPTPIALWGTILGCLAAVAWIVFTIIRDGKRLSAKK